jgi:MEDS: MEthanogen/methylotroph, DcmR Sensory domain
VSDLHEPIRLADTMLGQNRHICGFFYSPEEEYRLLLPFIREGFERGDKALHVVNPKLRDEHLRLLDSAGIDVAGAGKTGQLEVRNWDDVYFREGSFDADRVLSLWESAFDQAHQQGFPLTRLVAHMEWAQEDRPGVNGLLEYEAKFNLVSAEHRDPVICIYDVTKFGAGVIMDVLRTHPMIILAGIVQVNPFFVPPDQFLRELRDRQGTRRPCLRLQVDGRAGR